MHDARSMALQQTRERLLVADTEGLYQRGVGVVVSSHR
jgi:hypothetical protein